jgi:hypothetical protein
VAVRVVAGNHDMLEVGHPPDHVLDHGQQRLRDEQHARAAIRQHVGILIRGQKGVERHRHHAGADRAQKHRRKIHAVEHDHGDALFAADAEPAQHIGDALGLPLQITVGELGDSVREGEFLAAAFLDVAVEQPGDRVIGTAHISLPEPKPATTLLPDFKNYNS